MFNDGGSESGNEVVVKKKNGRPRIYGPTPAPSVISPEPSTPTPQKKKGKLTGSGRKQWLSGVGMFMFFISIMYFKLA